MPETIRRDYEHLEKANKTVGNIDAAARKVTSSRPLKKERPPMAETTWLGFFLIKEVLNRCVPISKVAVAAVPSYKPNGKSQYFLLDATSGVIPRIRKNMVLPITRVKFGDSCSYLAT